MNATLTLGLPYRLAKTALAFLIISLALTACMREQLIFKVVSKPLPQAAQALSETEVRDLIIAASQQAGWTVTENEQGRLIAEQRWRTHAAIVAISYSTKSYSIDYHNSVNLLVGRIPEGFIHREYNMRVQKLDSAIFSKLMRPEA